MDTELIHVGFGNVLAVNRVIAIVAPNSAPTKRLDPEEQGICEEPDDRPDQRPADEGRAHHGQRSHRPRRYYPRDDYGTSLFRPNGNPDSLASGRRKVSSAPLLVVLSGPSGVR